MTVTPRKQKTVPIGLSVTQHVVELAVFSPKTLSIEQAASIPVPEGLFDVDGDHIRDPGLLKEIISQLLRSVKPKPSLVHLSLPGTLLRLVEMPRIDPEGLYMSLSSEAERYKSFDNTDAIVDFAILNNPNLPATQQQVVFGAVRNDTLGTYLRILKDLHVKAATISLEPLNVLRAMAGTGVLDGLVQQIGSEAHWGAIFVEPTRVRISLWQCDRLVELRETAMETHGFAHATEDSILVEDMLGEVRRTTKSAIPSIWLTHNMPPAMERILASQLGVPVRPAPVGESLIVNGPVLQPATIGASMISMVHFPFDFDIIAGLSKSGGGVGGAIASAVDTSADDGGGDWLIPAGVLSLVGGGLVTAGLFAAALYSGQQLPPLESQRDAAKLEVSTLEAQKSELQKKAELDQTLMEMVKKAKIRNHVYVALTEDLKVKTPEKVWISGMKVDDAMEMVGKALNHQAVIQFARSFDTAPYTRAILIDAIKEGRLGSNLVYDFKIKGMVNLDPALLGGGVQPEETQTIQAPSAPGVKPGA